MQEKYINFFTDFGFKRLFGSEPNKACLINFLNSILQDKEAEIVDLHYSNNEQLGNSELDRKAIFYLHCQTIEGTRIIVELQKAKQQFFKDRSLFYSTFPIQEQAKKGNWTFQLANVYTIAILDFVFEDDSDTPDKYLHEVKLTEQETKDVFYDKLTFLYLEMPRFNKNKSQLNSEQDKWLYAIKNLSQLDIIPKELKSEIFEQFFQAAEVAKLAPSERNSYEQSLKYYRDLNNVIDTAFVEGKAEGLAEGKAEGLAEAIKKLMDKGMSKEEAEKLLS